MRLGTAHHEPSPQLREAKHRHATRRASCLSPSLHHPRSGSSVTQSAFAMSHSSLFKKTMKQAQPSFMPLYGYTALPPDMYGNALTQPDPYYTKYMGSASMNNMSWSMDTNYSSSINIHSQRRTPSGYSGSTTGPCVAPQPAAPSTDTMKPVSTRGCLRTCKMLTLLTHSRHPQSVKDSIR